MGPNDDDDGDGVGTGSGTVEARTSELRGGGLPLPPEPSDVGTASAPLGGRVARASAPVIAGSAPGERYRLGDLIGKGGMGEVVAAHDHQIGRGVAVKRMRRADPTPGQLERFLREARIQGRLDHPAIPPVHELARDDDGRPYFVMKRVAGTTLAEVLDRQARHDADALERFPRQRLLRAFADVCLAIEFAHNRGVVHRDLKPSNIMLGDFGEVYVLDWGIARVMGERERTDPGLAQAAGSTPSTGSPPTPSPSPPIVEVDSHTVPGSQLGTPGYMAPEQAIGAPDVDGRADVYALGCMLFEILACEPMHAPGTAVTRAVKGPDRRPSARPNARDVPPELEAVCVAATERDPDRRLATARELGERVQRYLDGDRDLAHRRDLAKEHFARATAALADDDGVTGRKAAMSEAGRALALDPTLTGAADLITRLMLEPPTAVPAEVVDEIAVEDRATVSRNARISVYGYFVLLAFVPIVLAVGVHDATYVWALVALVAINGAVSWAGMQGIGLRWRPIAVVAIHATMVFVLGRMFTPPLVAPGAAAVLTMALMSNPSYQSGARWLVVLAVMLAAALASYAVEPLGLMARTSYVVGDDLRLHSPALIYRTGLAAVINILWTTAIIVVAAGTARTMTRAERDARRRLHVQSWQLRQLVPDSTAAAPAA